MKELGIAVVSLRRLFRDRSNIFFVFILPMMLILILGVAFGGAGDSRLGVVVGDSGPLADELLGALETAEGMAVSTDYADSEALLDAVERGRLEGGLIIPAGYDAALESGEEAALEYVARDDPTALAVRNTIDSAVADQAAVVRAARFAEEQGTDEFASALVRARELADEADTLTIERETVGVAHPITTIGRFDLGAYSQLLLFVFLTSMTGSAALIQSRRLGISRRMLSTPTSVRTILVGEALGRFAVAMVQGLFIMLGSAVVFGADWGDPLAAALIVVVFSLGAAATGMLMGAVFKNDQQAGGAGVGIGIGLGAIGGCMLPLWVMKELSPTMYKVAHITPHAWGIEAFEETIMLGGHVGDILPELGVLLAYALVVIALATWRLRVTLTRA